MFFSIEEQIISNVSIIILFTSFNWIDLLSQPKSIFFIWLREKICLIFIRITYYIWISNHVRGESNFYGPWSSDFYWIFPLSLGLEDKIGNVIMLQIYFIINFCWVIEITQYKYRVWYQIRISTHDFIKKNSPIHNSFQNAKHIFLKDCRTLLIELGFFC